MLFTSITISGVSYIRRTIDNAVIPVDPKNMDYLNQLKWIAAGSPATWKYSND